jgi:hypothetical protein
MGEGGLKQAYIQVAERLHGNMKLPVSPEQGWKELKAELAKRV